MPRRLKNHSHDPQAISQRLAETQRPSYVGDGVLGAIDGCVTTIAIVAGAIGAGLSGTTIVILGVANLLADGLSMAVGNFQRARSELSLANLARRTEAQHIEQWPEGEREEVRQIFAAKGFEPPLLDEIVEVITDNRDRWIDTMVADEWGVGPLIQNPTRVAIVTFLAFTLAGIAPLIPFFIWHDNPQWQFQFVVALNGFVFVLIGVWRAHLYAESKWLGGLTTLLTGGTAATVAYVVADVLHRLFGL